jgi:hypothetical protein
VETPTQAMVRRLDRMVWPGALLIVALASTSAPAADIRPAPSAPRATVSQPLTASITWKMADRFGHGYDRNRNGRPDMPNSYEYVNPGRYEVHLKARIDAIDMSTEGTTCVWTIKGHAGAVEIPAKGPDVIARLPQGTQSVTVAIRCADGRTAFARETICVHDILIVALGDSLATGEGNPEVPARWDGTTNSERGSVLRGRVDPRAPAIWADGGPGGDQVRATPAGFLPPANLLHSRTHRSTHSGAARFAMCLEAEDPHTSVTFVCLAATGARTDDLFVTDHSDRNHALGPGPPLPAQFDELQAIVGSRPVDVLILAIGFNDARAIELLGKLIVREIQFVDPLRLLAVYPTRRDGSSAVMSDLDTLVDPTTTAVFTRLDPEARRKAIDQDVRLIYDLAEAAESGLASAREQLMRVGHALANVPILARAKVHLLEYPDLTRDTSGATAAVILEDLVPTLRVNRRELDLADERLVRPLNRALSDVAARQGWTYVGGFVESFATHGYAAKDTWFVRAKESEQIQGPRLTVVGYLRGEIAPGMLHPNLRGHQAIADRLLQSRAKKKTVRESPTAAVSRR